MTGGLLLGALLAAAAGEGPPAPAVPRLVAAIESEQGEGSERTALFDDGTLVDAVRFRARTFTNRKNLTTDERDVVRRVCSEALALPDDGDLRSPTLPEKNARKMRIEIVDPKGRSRFFAFDELVRLPLPLGRARGALEDLRARFYPKEGPKTDATWDASAVKEDDLLRRRGDGLWFRVRRDDRFERGFELEEIGGHGLRMLVLREQLPKMFLDPSGSENGPERAP